MPKNAFSISRHAGKKFRDGMPAAGDGEAAGEDDVDYPESSRKSTKVRTGRGGLFGKRKGRAEICSGDEDDAAAGAASTFRKASEGDGDAEDDDIDVISTSTEGMMSVVGGEAPGDNAPRNFGPQDVDRLTIHMARFKDAFEQLQSCVPASLPPVEDYRGNALASLERCHTALRNVQEHVGADMEEAIQLCQRLTETTSKWEVVNDPAGPADFRKNGDAMVRACSMAVENFLLGFESAEKSADERAEELPEDVRDLAGFLLKDGMKVLLARTKAWSRQCQDLIEYLEDLAKEEREGASRRKKRAEEATKKVANADKKSKLHNSSFMGAYAKLLEAHQNQYDRVVAYCDDVEKKVIRELDEKRKSHDKRRSDIKHKYMDEEKALSDSREQHRVALKKYHEAYKRWEKAALAKAEEQDSGKAKALEKLQVAEEKARKEAEERKAAYVRQLDATNVNIQQFEAHDKAAIREMKSLSEECETTWKVCLHRLTTLTRDLVAPLEGTVEEVIAHVKQINGVNDVVSHMMAASEGQFLAHPLLEYEEYVMEERARLYLGLDLVDGQRPMVAARSRAHRFQKLDKPDRCGHCRMYTSLQGMVCADCNVVAHKRCKDKIPPCAGQATERFPGNDLAVFAVSLQRVPRENGCEVPSVVERCVAEVEKRGLDREGIYRRTAQKSRLERLCELVEKEGLSTGAYASESDVYVVADLLKHFLQKLPEPVITHDAYDQLIRIASEEGRPAQIRDCVARLPGINYATLARLIRHLVLVAEHEPENKMKPSNLAVVFGPTLLRPRVQSVNALVDIREKIRIVELMIRHCELVFPPDNAARRLGMLAGSAAATAEQRASSGAYIGLANGTTNVRGSTTSSQGSVTGLTTTPIKEADVSDVFTALDDTLAASEVDQRSVGDGVSTSRRSSFEGKYKMELARREQEKAEEEQKRAREEAQRRAEAEARARQEAEAAAAAVAAAAQEKARASAAQELASRKSSEDAGKAGDDSASGSRRGSTTLSAQASVDDQQPGEPKKVCVCGAKARFLCTICRQQFYCGRDCQKSHWPDHRAMCKIWSQQAVKRSKSEEEKGAAEDAGRVTPDAARKAMEEEAARKRAAEEAQRQAEAARRAVEEEAARRAAEEEARRKQEEAARKKAEEEARARAAVEEAARAETQRKAEEEARAKAAAEEAARAEARRQAEEAMRKAEEDARRLAAEEEAKRRAAEEEAARIEAEARRLEEEAAAAKAASAAPVASTSSTTASGPVAAWDYEARSENEVSMKKGDPIRVIAKVNADWLHGEIRGKSGYIPAKYVWGL